MFMGTHNIHVHNLEVTSQYIIMCITTTIVTTVQLQSTLFHRGHLFMTLRKILPTSSWGIWLYHQWRFLHHDGPAVPGRQVIYPLLQFFWLPRVASPDLTALTFSVTCGREQKCQRYCPGCHLQSFQKLGQLSGCNLISFQQMLCFSPDLFHLLCLEAQFLMNWIQWEGKNSTAFG